MSIKTIKYFSTIIVAIVAVLAGWWLWNYYMQSPWTRDGKIRAEQVSITPQVSGRIVELNIKDNQLELRHIREGAPAQITLYSDNKTLQGHVSSIGRAIYDQSVESDSSLIPDVKPNVPWVRLAQRVPVRFALDKVPGDVTLVSGTTCSIAVGQ
ncbi:hypothetical protein BV389_17350 [Escherichia coli]|uniref:HlyD family secretion protein n=1 Tax=Escherichia coli TaxID=562 RepID=UPI0009917385|nr:HlyD family secretion protein [Escherichia coli]OON48024.1 hypothetical protein BV389_17350 [Escherichia coli]